jgi:hypothetical protein
VNHRVEKLLNIDFHDDRLVAPNFDVLVQACDCLMGGLASSKAEAVSMKQRLIQGLQDARCQQLDDFVLQATDS